MDLSFNEQQRVIKTTAGDFFQANCPMSLVRELENGAPGYSPDMWRQMAGLGWLGITFPEQYGGAGHGFLDLYVIYEEMGRFLVPSPHLPAVVLGGETVLRAGSEEQKRRLLPAISKGELLIAPAIMEPNGTYGPSGIEMSATAEGNGYRLSGTKLLVPFAEASDYLLCVARTGKAGGGADGITLFLVERRSPGIAIESLQNIASSQLSAVTFDNVAVGNDAVLGSAGHGWAPFSQVFNRATVLQCAEIVGAAGSVLDMTTNYAKDRVQFGRPIGSFQAVQYLCSDVAIDMATISLLAKQAAWLIDEGLPHDREVAIAGAAASKGIQHLTRQAHEVHAGVAFMVEHDLQMFTRRAKSWELNLGDPGYHQEALAEAMGL